MATTTSISTATATELHLISYPDGEVSPRGKIPCYWIEFSLY